MYLIQLRRRIISMLLVTAFICALGINPYAVESGGGTKFVYAVEPTFDYLGYLIEGMATTTEGLKVGYVSTDGKVLKPQWDQAYQYKNGMAVVELNGQFGLIDKTGNYVVPLGKYKYIEYSLPFTDGFVKVSNNPGYDTGNVWGLVDTATGKEILKPEYSRIEPFSEELALVLKRGDVQGNEKDKYGYIDKTGKFVIPLKFQSAGPFSEGVAGARIEQNGKYGYIDKSGSFVIKPQWDDAAPFEEGYAQIAKGILRGLVHRSGIEVVKPISFPIPAYWIYEGKVKMLNENKLHTYENTGEHSAVAFPLATEIDGLSMISMSNFHDGLAWIESNGKVGYIDKKGDIVLPLKWDLASDFSNGVATVQIHDEIGYVLESYLINTRGEVLYKENSITWDFNNGLYSYYKGSKYYVIDATGKLLFPGEWEDMKEFSEGYAPVQKNGKWGYIDKTGSMVIEPQWEYAEPFNNGHAIVVKDGKYGIIKLIEGK